MAPLFTERTPTRPITPKRQVKSSTRDTIRDTRSVQKLRTPRQRLFGDIITNTVPRPVFKTRHEECEATPTKNHRAYQREHAEPVTPFKSLASAHKENHTRHIAFRERRAQDGRDDEVGPSTESPTRSLKKHKNGDTSLSALVKTRALELQTKRPDSHTLAVDPREWHQWNPYCFMGPEKLLLNPRRLPLENASMYEVSHGIYALSAL